MPAKVVLDSNVLYSARLRDLWMELGVAGLVSLVWTDRIEAEWIAAVLRSRPDLERYLRRTASLMRQVLPQACVAVDPADEAAISLPDPDDRHVLAAARASGAEAIVTANVADFSTDLLGLLNIEIITPDAISFAWRQMTMKVFSRPLRLFVRVSARLRSMPPTMRRASRVPAVPELQLG